MEVPASSHLVRRIKERQQPLLLHSLQDAAPLLEGGVHAGGVVRAGVQHHNGALWGTPQILDHPLQRQRDTSASESRLQRPLTRRDQPCLPTGRSSSASPDSKLPENLPEPQIWSRGLAEQYLHSPSGRVRGE